jgi:hypothetical protein
MYGILEEKRKMTKTPTKTEILAKASELYFNDMAKSGINNFNNPEPNELAESGYIQTARSTLMRDQYRSMVENKDYMENLEDFAIDIEQLFESNGLILGSRHTGKSDVAMLIADKCMEKGSIVVCFDPSQDWQNRSSIPSFQTLTSPYINTIPIESTIFDISLLSPNQSQQIVESFCGKLFRQQAETPDRKKYLVVFEESHVYFPQGCMRAKAYQNTVKLLSVGRNLGISCLLISQFSSMLDKFAIKHSVSQTYLGFTKEFNDLKYLRSLLGSDVEQLTKLNDGEFLYLTRNDLSKINIEPYESNIHKQEIFSKIPQLEPLKPIQQKANNDGIIDLLKFITCAGIVIYALINMPK